MDAGPARLRAESAVAHGRSAHDALVLDPPPTRLEPPGARDGWPPPGKIGGGPASWLMLALVAGGIVLLAVLSAVGVSSMRDKVYGARAEILYTSSDDVSSDARDRTLATQRQIILSRSVLAAAAADSGRSIEALRDAVSVEVGRDDLLRVTAEDASPDAARRMADAVTSQYLAFTPRLSRGAKQAERVLQRQIDRLRGRGEPLSPADAEELARLEDRLLDVQVDAASAPRAQLVSPAYVLDGPVSPNTRNAIAVGLMLGLLLATAVVVLELRRQAVRRAASPS